MANHRRKDLLELTIAEIGPRGVVDEDFLAALAAAYALRLPLETRDLGGEYNLNLRVRDADGSDLVIHAHRPWVTRARLWMLHSIRQALIEQGLPVPEPVATEAGESVWRYTDRWVDADAYVPNDGGAGSWDRYAAAFSMLGRLHEALEAHGEEIAFLPPRVSSYSLPGALLPWIENTERALEPHGNGTTAAAAPEATAGVVTAEERLTEMETARSACHEARKMLATLAEWWEEEGVRLPAQPVHGDYGADNILYRHGEIAALLDFDFLAVRERLFDIAFALYQMFAHIEGSRPPAEVSWGRIPEMVARYNAEATRPLTRAETRALPLEIARIPLYGFAESGFTPDPVASAAARAGGVHFARFVLSHADDLAHALG